MAGEFRDKLFDRVGNVIVYVLGALIVALVVGYVNLWSTVSKLENVQEKIERRPDERLVRAWLDRQETAIDNWSQYSAENRNRINRLNDRFNSYMGRAQKDISAPLDMWTPSGGKNPYENLPTYPINNRRDYALTKVTYDY